MAKNCNKFFTPNDKIRHTRGWAQKSSGRSTSRNGESRETANRPEKKYYEIKQVQTYQTMTKFCRTSPQRGMTLVEFLVVIAIIGIIAGVFGLQFMKYAPTYELRSNARTLFAEIQNAKIGAIRSGRNWGVVCNEGTSVCDIYSSDGADDDFSTAGDNVLFKSVDMKTSKHDIRIGHGSATTAIGGGAIGADNVTYVNNILIFNNRGVSNAGIIYIQNENDESYAVGTNMFGNIFLRRWDGGVWN